MCSENSDQQLIMLQKEQSKDENWRSPSELFNSVGTVRSPLRISTIMKEIQGSTSQQELTVLQVWQRFLQLLPEINPRLK